MHNTQMNIDEITKSFLLNFDIHWNEFLNSIDLKYSSSKQLFIGNRTRPVLVLWGYILGYDGVGEIPLSNLAHLAVSIEAIHKASVIMDDIIDDDNKRRGEQCLHIEYSSYEAVFFAVSMLAKATDLPSKILDNNNSDLYKEAIGIVSSTIYEMCKGALLELTISREQYGDLEHIKKIINLETVSLIKNSLLLGYQLTTNKNGPAEDLITSIGKKCGYIFQVMNDLEPFCNPSYIIKYKGNLNSDIMKSRKSIVLPYLYENTNKLEKQKLIEILDGKPDIDILIDILIDMFNKHSINKIIEADLDLIFSSIYDLIDKLSESNVKNNYIYQFKEYVGSLKTHYLTILNDGVK